VYRAQRGIVPESQGLNRFKGCDAGVPQNVPYASSRYAPIWAFSLLIVASPKVRCGLVAGRSLMSVVILLDDSFRSVTRLQLPVPCC
jgi:hypothetical protein